MEYTAESIRILDHSEAAQRFAWLDVETLATRYRRPAAWIARGLEACRRAGVDRQYFVDRYLEKRDVPRNPIVDEAFRELLNE